MSVHVSISTYVFLWVWVQFRARTGESQSGPGLEAASQLWVRGQMSSLFFEMMASLTEVVKCGADPSNAPVCYNSVLD